MAARNKVDVEIFGEHYKIKGEAAPEYMTRLARYVDQTMRKVVRRNPRLTVHKAAVLAAINIADELLKVLDQQEAETGADNDSEANSNTETGNETNPETGKKTGNNTVSAEEANDQQPAKQTGKKKTKKKKSQG